MINYAELKSAMSALGYAMSSGTGWTASDDDNYRSYLYLHQNNLNTYLGKMGMAYTGILPEGFPGTSTKTLVSLAISGYDAPLLIGVPQQLVATGTYDDESTEDVTASVNWESSDELVAVVDAGLVTGVANGSADITASVGGITSPAVAVTVETATPELVNVVIELPSSTLVVGTNQDMVARAHYDDESTEDVTAQVTAWYSSDPGVAAFADPSIGIVDAIAEGTTNITCDVLGITSDAAVLTVTEE